MDTVLEATGLHHSLAHLEHKALRRKMSPGWAASKPYFLSAQPRTPTPQGPCVQLVHLTFTAGVTAEDVKGLGRLWSPGLLPERVRPTRCKSPTPWGLSSSPVPLTSCSPSQPIGKGFCPRPSVHPSGLFGRGSHERTPGVHEGGGTFTTSSPPWFLHGKICKCNVTINTMEYYSAIKKNDFLPFATTWMNLEGIIREEISQTEKTKPIW